MIHKFAVLSLMMLTIGVSAPAAKTMYTSDTTVINVRKGKDTSFPVIATLKSNEPVTVLESAQGWTKIQLADGTQGWLISSYLSDTPPAQAPSIDNSSKTDHLARQLKVFGEENERLKKQLQSLQTQLDMQSKELSDLRASAKAHPESAKEAAALKAKLDQISIESDAKSKRIAELERQASQAGGDSGRYKCYLYLFLSGAGVLLLGMMIGANTKRRRSSLL